MRILHVLSQTELTGAEVYAISLAKQQREKGHDVLLVSDALHIAHDLPYLRMPISKRSWPNRWSNASALRALVKEKKIDVVHAHSRASSWVSHWATKGLRCAYVSTVHGRQHLHSSTRLYSVYGQQVIAVCENIRKHLQNEVGIPTTRLHGIPNGFETFVPESKGKGILLAGRTTGPKGQASSQFLTLFLKSLLETYKDQTFTIVGGKIENLSSEAQLCLKEAQSLFSERVRVFEYVNKNEMDRLVRESSIVIASGRIAVEALGAGKKLIAMGEAIHHGWIQENTYEIAKASNFGDISTNKEDFPQVEAIYSSLQEALKNQDSASGNCAQKIQEDFSLDKVEMRVEKVYFQALLEKRAPSQIPILMYHKVVEDGFESKHKTYISVKNFEQQLMYLQRKHCSPITFQDLYRMTLEDSPFPAKPIILTFDDGYRSMVTRALPLLKKFQFRAVFYLLADFTIQKNFWDPGELEPELMTKNEIHTLIQSGMEIGAHSFGHSYFPKLTEKEIFHEIVESKKVLEKEFNVSVYSFAYPFGAIDQKSKSALNRSPFFFGVSTDSGGRYLFEDLNEIFRINIFPQDIGTKFRKKTSSWYRPYYFWKRGK